MYVSCGYKRGYDGYLHKHYTLLRLLSLPWIRGKEYDKIFIQIVIIDAQNMNKAFATN